MEKRTLEYEDSDLNVVLEIRQATVTDEWKYQAELGRQWNRYGVEPPKEETDDRRWFWERSMMVSLYPALLTIMTVKEDRNGNFPELTVEAVEQLPGALVTEIQEMVYEVNPHWNPFSVKVKRTGSGSTNAS